VASVIVESVSGAAAVAVPQVYISSSQASPLNPQASLVGFTRVDLAAGSAARTVSIPVDTADLAEPWQDADGAWMPAIIPGHRKLFLANDAGFLAGNGALPLATFAVEITSADGLPVPIKRCSQY
jgi:hypothetical protein